MCKSDSLCDFMQCLPPSSAGSELVAAAVGVGSMSSGDVQVVCDLISKLGMLTGEKGPLEKVAVVIQRSCLPNWLAGKRRGWW